MNHRILSLAALLACACAEPTSIQNEATAGAQFSKLDAAAYDLIDLGTFGTSNQAFGIDDNGTVFGRYTQGTYSGSFRWTEKTGFEDLGTIDNRPFQFLRTNKHEMLTGWAPGNTANVPLAVAYLPHGGFRFIDDVATYGGQAWGVNKYGDVVGQRFPLAGGANEAFMWNERDGMSAIPVVFPAGTPRGSTAVEVTDDRVVLGTVSVFNPPPVGLQTYAYIWTASGGTQILPKLSTGQVGVSDVNDDHVAIGAAESRAPLPGERRTNPLSFSPGDVPVHAWRWSPKNGLEDLGTLGGQHSVAWTIDTDGNAYGWAMDNAGVQRAVKWPVSGPVIRLPDLGGATQTGAVNKHGVLAAQSATNAGATHAVIYVPSGKK